MKVTTFTETMIRRLRPGEKKFIRGEGNGFNIRVMPSGAKSWIYLYTFDGKRREMNLGSYPDVSLETAREKFDAARRKLRNGIDPLVDAEEAAHSRRVAHTVADLVKEYLDRHAKRFKRSWEEDERILNKEVVPVWGNTKLADIKKRDVIHLLEGIVDRGAPGMANNTFKIIRKMFNYAVEKDILPYTPAAGLKLPSPLNTRERVLNEEEIRTLWDTLEISAMNDDTRRALKLILVTAQRPGEVTGMHTDEIDGRWWTVPSERAKNGRAHRVYLTDLALECIGPLKVVDKETKEVKSKGYIFPCPHKKKVQQMDRHALSRAIMRNIAWPMTDENGNIILNEDGAPATQNKLGIEHFTPHDLRRSAATFMAQMGFIDEIIDAVLNHTKQGVIRVYNQYRYEREKQQALEAWEQKLKVILGLNEDAETPSFNDIAV